MRSKNDGVESAWPVVYLAILGTLGLQSMRVLLPNFVYYLGDVRGVDSLTLAPIALGTFALGLLAWPLHRMLGVERGLLLSAGGLALFRLLEQVSFRPSLDLYLSGAALVFFMVSLPLAFGWLRNKRSSGGAEFGMGVLAAFILDTAIHTAGWTLDLSWRRGWAPLGVVFLLAAGLLLAIWRTLGAESRGGLPVMEGRWGLVLPLAALGPYTFFHLLVYQNIARTAAYTGWEIPAAGVWTALANLAALGALAWVSSRGGLGFSLRLAVAIGLLATTLAPAGSGVIPVVLSAMGVVFSAVLVQTVLMRSPENGDIPGLRRTSVAFFLGFQVMAVATFLYYVTLEIDLGFRAPAVLPAAAGVVALAGLSGPRMAGGARTTASLPGVLAAALLAVLLPLGIWVTWRSPEPRPATAEPGELRVMTYNLHQGFDTTGLLDIEALARVIEQQSPDVVALQEVSRGYLVNGSLDMLSWLSRRLDMAAEFGPAADPQWGNALLTRLPLDQVMNVPLPPDSLSLRRGFLDARFRYGGSQLRLIATHLHHLGEDSEIRQVQAQSLLAAWGQSPNTILLGDLNAEPGAPEMALLGAAGWTDAALAAGSQPRPTYPSDRPERRIDYILVSQGLEPAESWVISTQASDHLPLIATLVSTQP